MRLLENAHLPFDKLTALSKTEGPFGRGVRAELLTPRRPPA
jgi:hypothetical protein